jgi:hypothetical protein
VTVRTNLSQVRRPLARDTRWAIVVRARRGFLNVCNDGECNLCSTYRCEDSPIEMRWLVYQKPSWDRRDRSIT